MSRQINNKVGRAYTDDQEPSFSFNFSEDRDQDRQLNELGDDISDFSFRSSLDPKESDASLKRRPDRKIPDTTQNLHIKPQNSAAMPKKSIVVHKSASPGGRSSTSNHTKIVSIPLHPPPTALLPASSEYSEPHNLSRSCILARERRTSNVHTQDDKSDPPRPMSTAAVQEILNHYDSPSTLSAESDSPRYAALRPRPVQVLSIASAARKTTDRNRTEENAYQPSSPQPQRTGSSDDETAVRVGPDNSRPHLPAAASYSPGTAATRTDSAAVKETKEVESEPIGPPSPPPSPPSSQLQRIQHSPQRPRDAPALGSAAQAPARTGRSGVERTLASWLRESSSGEDAVPGTGAAITGIGGASEVCGDEGRARRDDAGDQQAAAHGWVNSEDQMQAGLGAGGAGGGAGRDEGDSLLEMVASTVAGGRHGGVDDRQGVQYPAAPP